LTSWRPRVKCCDIDLSLWQSEKVSLPISERRDHEEAAIADNLPGILKLVFDQNDSQFPSKVPIF
jgi:hypothetical protein